MTRSIITQMVKQNSKFCITTDYYISKITRRTRPSSLSSRLNKLEFSVMSLTFTIGSGMLVVKSP